jgi:hypothetical protein
MYKKIYCLGLLTALCLVRGVGGEDCWCYSDRVTLTRWVSRGLIDKLAMVQLKRARTESWHLRVVNNTLFTQPSISFPEHIAPYKFADNHNILCVTMKS